MKQSRLKMQASFPPWNDVFPLNRPKESNRDWYIHDCTCTCMHEYWKLKKSREGVRGIILFSMENRRIIALFTGIWNSYIYSTIRYLVSQTYLYLVLPFNKSQCCIRTYFILFLFDPYEFPLVDPRPPLTTAAVKEHTQCDPHRAHHHDRHRDRPVQK